MRSHGVISATRSHSRCGIRIECFQPPLSPVASFPLLALGSDIPPMRGRWSEPTPASPPATEARKLLGYPGAGPHPWKGNQACACCQKPELPSREGDCKQWRGTLPELVPRSSVAPGEFLSGMQRRLAVLFWKGHCLHPIHCPGDCPGCAPNEGIRTE